MMASEYDLDEKSGGGRSETNRTIRVRQTVVNPEFPKNISESMRRNDLEALKRSNEVSCICIHNSLVYIFVCEYHSLHMKC